MKKLLKLTGTVVGVAAVAGTTAYVLTQTESGRQFVRRVKTKVAELQTALAEQLEEAESLLDDASLMKPVIVYDRTKDIAEIEPQNVSHSPEVTEVIRVVRQDCE